MFKFYLCLILMLTAVPSFARVKLSAVYVPTYSYPIPTSNRGGWGIGGGGLLAEIGNGKLGIEFGALYQTQILNSVSSSNIEIPVGLRIWPSRFFTFSVGGFVDYQISNLPANMNALDYGVRATLGVNIPITKFCAFMTEVGIRYGIANLARSPSPALNQVQAMGLIGFRFGDNSKK